MALGYNRYSPYSKTELFGTYLDVANIPVIPATQEDVTMTVNKTYQYRPDLLAFDLYGDAALWWVFAARNPNLIKDPVFDMKIGQVIFLPRKDIIQSTLG